MLRSYSPQMIGAFLSGCGVAAVMTMLLMQTPHVYAGSDGKVAPWTAMKSAVAKVPGSKAYSATYAQEGGHWLYDVIVVKGGALTEVEVDATTGKVGDTEAATPAQEGKELTDELNKALGHPVKGGEANEKGEKPD